VAKTKVLAHNCGERGLNAALESNFKRFVSKIPANSKSSASYKFLEDGNVLFEAVSPAKNIPGSYAKYQKWVDKTGKTIKYLKTTVGPNGEIIHVKVK
jgi:hypothetical protein